MMQANELVALIIKHGEKSAPNASFIKVNKLLEDMSDSDIEGFMSLLNKFRSPDGPLQIDLIRILNTDCYLYCWRIGRDDTIVFVLRDGEWHHEQYAFNTPRKE